MKKKYILLSIFLIFVLVACNSNGKKNNTENTNTEKTSTEKLKTNEIESYKNGISVNYFGINNKTFKYNIKNDNKGICKIDTEKKYKNGDTLTINCSDKKSGIDFKKDMKIDSLLDDNIDDPEINVAINSKASGSKYTLVRQNDYGFSLILIKENNPGLYDTEIYDTIFFNKNGLYTIKDFSVDKMYSNEDLVSHTEPDIKVTDIKKEYLDETINHYIEQGFKKYN